MITIDSRELDRRLRVERPIADESLRGAGSGTWALVDTVWAKVQDALPSRGEQGGTATMLIRPARVWLRYRTDLDSTMRFVGVEDGRVMVITAGPAVLGRRAGLEFAVAEYMPGGNAA